MCGCLWCLVSPTPSSGGSSSGNGDTTMRFGLELDTTSHLRQADDDEGCNRTIRALVPAATATRVALIDQLLLARSAHLLVQSDRLRPAATVVLRLRSTCGALLCSSSSSPRRFRCRSHCRQKQAATARSSRPPWRAIAGTAMCNRTFGPEGLAADQHWAPTATTVRK